MTLRTQLGLALIFLSFPLSLSACSGSGTNGSASAGSNRGSSGSASGTGSTSEILGSGVASWAGHSVAETAIPLGDGKLSTAPKVGYEDTCTLSFRGGGARSSGPWVDTSSDRWNLKAKVSVEGSNSWPNASHSFTVQGSERVLATNDLPQGATTGNFPISPSDPAHRYDANPNSVKAQSFSWTVPATPSAAATPFCTGLGPTGVMTNGVLMFNALDAAGRDAGAHEVQDACDGHPEAHGIYHYHDLSACLQPSVTAAAGSSTLVGYALDGYGVYVERDAKGNLPTDTDLDDCHGRTSTVMWDGKRTTMYHYDATLEYPYFVGCFRGTPVSGTPRQ